MQLPDKTYPATEARRVAFIGLGTMGGPMAAHLHRAGHEVRAYNRGRERAVAWANVTDGTVCASPFQAVAGCEFVFSCVGNDDDLRSVALGTEGAFDNMEPGSVFVDHTTTSAEVARELAAAARERGLHFIDAPVSGGNLGALNGVLTVMCGGELVAFERAQPVISAYARAVTLLGPAGNGQLAKMVNQICVAGVLQGLSEALAFGERAGLDMEAVLGVIGKGAAQSWQMENRGPTMLENRFDFGFAVDWMHKDLGLCLSEARRNGARLPTTALIDQFYAQLQTRGDGRLDTSSLIKLLRG